jgi:hypothetical protein
MCASDKELNDLAVEDGSRVHSAYEVGHEKVWIISECDRSVTTILLPDEYAGSWRLSYGKSGVNADEQRIYLADQQAEGKSVVREFPQRTG